MTNLIFFVCVICAVIFVAKIVLKNTLNNKYKELSIEDKLICKLRTSAGFGKYYWFTFNFSIPFVTVYFYEKYLVIRCMGYAQKYEYNRKTMDFQKFFCGMIPYLVINTNNSKIFVYLGGKETELVQNLIEKNSH